MAINIIEIKLRNAVRSVSSNAVFNDPHSIRSMPREAILSAHHPPVLTG